MPRELIKHCSRVCLWGYLWKRLASNQHSEQRGLPSPIRLDTVQSTEGLTGTNWQRKGRFAFSVWADSSIFSSPQITTPGSWTLLGLTLSAPWLSAFGLTLNHTISFPRSAACKGQMVGFTASIITWADSYSQCLLESPNIGRTPHSLLTIPTCLWEERQTSILFNPLWFSCFTSDRAGTGICFEHVH